VDTVPEHGRVLTDDYNPVEFYDRPEPRGNPPQPGHVRPANVTRAAGHGCGQSSADFQSAGIARFVIGRRTECLLALRAYAPSAECNSAIRQIGNLRYFVTGPAQRAFGHG